MEEKKIGIAILGSTGRIGQLVIDNLKKYSNPYSIEVLTANNNADLLIQQALELKPNAVVINNESKRQQVDDVLWREDIKTYAGADALHQVTEMKELHVVVNVIAGNAGIKPSVMAAASGKNLILGNSDSILLRGNDIMDEIIRKGTKLLPIHPLMSAFFQLIKGEEVHSISNVTLQSEENETLLKSICTIFDIAPHKFNWEPNLPVQAQILFLDGVEKSINKISEEQAIRNALFFPLRLSH